jgi:LTXXQ motif family protein
MRPPRLVLVSALLIPALITGSAQARPRLPGIFGAVFGVVGGMVGLHHGRAWARTHYPARQVAAGAPAQPRAETEPPTQPNIATAGQIATTGPLFWPQIADDVFDYVLWPSGTDDRLWAYGYDDIVDGALRPDSRVSAPRRGRPQPTAAVASGAGGVPGACAAQQGSETADSLIARIEQTIQPTDAQRATLDDLHVAVRHGLDYIDTACPTDRPLTPTARLDGMEDRIWAARQALLLTRAPLEQLYGSLTDEQKARLNGPVNQTAARRAGCSTANADLPAALIAGRIRPAPKQRPGLEALRMTSAGLAKLLASSCPAALPATPVERLDAADKRLNSLLYAVVTLRAPLDGLYASLTDEQKTQLSGLRR